MDSPVGKFGQEQEPFSNETPAQQLQTSTPFVHTVDNPTGIQQPSFANQDVSFARLEASSIAEISRDSNTVESELATDNNMSMNSSITALKGSFTEDRAFLNDLELLASINAPELSNNQLNKGFCSESSIVLKSQQEECSVSDKNDIQNAPQSSSMDDVTPVELQEEASNEVNTTIEAKVDCDHNESARNGDEQCCEFETDKPQTTSGNYNGPHSTPDKNAEPPITITETEKVSVQSEQLPSETVPGDEEAMGVASNSEDQSEKTTAHNTTNSIYLNDEETPKQPPPPSKAPKRLTMAQRAAMEALASFGGSDLASVSVRKRDLRSELKRDAERMKAGGNDETGKDGVEPPPAKRPRTRLQRAQQEVQSMFKDIPLGDRSTRSRGAYKRGAVTQRTSAKGRSRVQRARDEALAAFGGESLDSLSKKTNQTSSATTSNQPAPLPARRLTQVERAKLEALQSFGGSGFSDVMGGAKRRVARTLEKKVESEGVEGEGVESEGVTCEGKENENNTAVVDVK